MSTLIADTITTLIRNYGVGAEEEVVGKRKPAGTIKFFTGQVLVFTGERIEGFTSENKQRYGGKPFMTVRHSYSTAPALAHAVAEFMDLYVEV